MNMFDTIKAGASSYLTQEPRSESEVREKLKLSSLQLFWDECSRTKFDDVYADPHAVAMAAMDAVSKLRRKADDLSPDHVLVFEGFETHERDRYYGREPARAKPARPI